ncbi:lipopolysaccharide biosynthesis protein [Nonomuraea sp. LPB2021202275-12-8]|uniref:lipopolysaccharide biosynthesis protein n=1 Tax=Nonomuraea sp. LPB2021202275-12-8 TaxID=3120159 RepID=UPI00300C978A
MTSEEVVKSGPGLVARLRTDLRNPLFLQGYALMANTAATAVLGLGYWFLAVRLYSPAAFGEGQLMITAMRLFSSLVGLAFVGVMARFIPISGAATSKLVLRGYLVAGVTAVLAALGFLLTLPLWGAAYAELATLVPALFFLGSVLVWTIFTLQDVVLAGLRKAIWVPVNSTVFGVGKMVLLVVLAFVLPTGGMFGGIFVSWIVPTAAALIPISWLIFKVAIPQHVIRTGSDAAPPRLREIGRFVAGDFSGALSTLLVLYLVPVMVGAWLNDPEMFGYFSVTHTLGCMMGLLAANMAVSLTVEGSLDSARLAQTTRNALRRTFLIVGPVVAVVVLAAPLILLVFGPELSEAGTPLLRLMALGVLPMALVEIRLGTLRARSEARKLATIQIGMTVLVFASVIALFPVAGITGVGYALLASQTVTGLCVLPGLRKVLALPRTQEVA